MSNNNYKDRLKQVKSISNNPEKCCYAPQVESNNGDIVCMKCGMTFGRKYVDDERRQYNQQEVDERKHNEPRWREVGARTLIPNVKYDAKGKYLTNNHKQLFNRLSKVQNSLISSIERNFWDAKPQLKMICTKLNISHVIKDTAWSIYKESAKKKLTMGRSIIGFVTASLYVAIRIHEFPMTLDEVTEGATIPRRITHSALGIVVQQVLPEMGLKYKPITPELLIVKFGNELNLSTIIQRNAVSMLENARIKGFTSNGKDPKGVAASLLYFVGKNSSDIGDRRTQSEIAEVSKITEVTLRSRVKDIKNCF